MQNLEQLRAAHASSAARQLDQKLDRSAVSKLPALITNNGFLATLSFTLDSSSREGLLVALLKVADYLRQRGLLTRPAQGENIPQAAMETQYRRFWHVINEPHSREERGRRKAMETPGKRLPA